MNPYTVGKPPAKSKALLYVGLASFFCLLMIIVIVIVAGGSGSKGPDRQPSQASAGDGKQRSSAGQYGAKYAPYDPRMVMTEETEMAKERKKRRAQGGH